MQSPIRIHRYFAKKDLGYQTLKQDEQDDRSFDLDPNSYISDRRQNRKVIECVKRDASELDE